MKSAPHLRVGNRRTHEIPKTVLLLGNGACSSVSCDTDLGGDETTWKYE